MATHFSFSIASIRNLLPKLYCYLHVVYDPVSKRGEGAEKDSERQTKTERQHEKARERARGTEKGGYLIAQPYFKRTGETRKADRQRERASDDREREKDPSKRTFQVLLTGGFFLHMVLQNWPLPAVILRWLAFAVTRF